MTEKQCPVYRKCGACQLQNLPYQKQLAWKQKRCKTLLGEFSAISPILGMADPYHYRCKVQAAFGFYRGRILAGRYQSSTRRIVPVQQCLTEDVKADEVIVTIHRLMRGFKLTAYDERTGRGLLRFVLIKRGLQTGELMVVLVTARAMLPNSKHLVKALREAHPEITTIVQNIKEDALPMVLGQREKVLYGPGTIRDRLCGCTFQISPQSFYQINPRQTEVLYRKAMEAAGLTGTEKVLDAYCGIGTIGIIAAKDAGTVCGVESNREAVRDAVINARENGLANTRFVCMDAAAFMQEAAAEKADYDVVFLDPPRTGASGALINSIGKLAPEKVVYISCNPETLARDLRMLRGKGYKAQWIQPVDMFPHTNHIECVVLMTRNDE